MPRGKRASDELVKVIYKLRDEGKRKSQISQITGVCDTTIGNILRRRIRQTSDQRKVSLGRPRSTNAIQDARLVRSVTRNVFDNFKVTARRLNVSWWTLRRRCIEQGIRSRTAFINVLTPQQRRVRVNWCRRHRGDNFRRFVFSDEVIFRLRRNILTGSGKLRVYRRAGTKLAPINIFNVPRVQEQGTLTMWGCFSATGFGICRISKETMNSEKYLTTLQNYLLPSLDLLFPAIEHPHVTFQHDNATPHKAITIRNWLNEQLFRTVDWPPYSPDLNPIENVWGMMKRAISLNPPTTLAELENFIFNYWNRLDANLANRLVDSMNRRCTKVIQRNGLRV